MSNGNRAILLTAPGAAAIAVIRIVGPGVGAFLHKYFSRDVRESRCVHGQLRDGDRVIDDPVIVTLPDHRGADISLHGGPWVIQACFDLLRDNGFDIHEHRDGAIDSGAIDGANQIEQEMLQHIGLAATELALKTLLVQPHAWARFVATNPSAQAIRAVREDQSLWWLLHHPRVAIVGEANVGKSTLANQLFAQQRSITADLPGTTRDWVGEIANLQGLALMLVDTPGFRETDDPIEQAAIERARNQVSQSDLVIVVLDVTRGLIEQESLASRFSGALRVANKCDLPHAWEVTNHSDLLIAAKSGVGIDALCALIRNRFVADAINPDKPRWWTSRQRELLDCAIIDPTRIVEIVG